jgi:hypothetical protein
LTFRAPYLFLSGKHQAAIEQQFQAETIEVQLSCKAVRSLVQLIGGSDNGGLGLSADTTDALQHAFISSDVRQFLSLAVKHHFVARWQQVSLTCAFLRFVKPY